MCNDAKKEATAQSLQDVITRLEKIKQDLIAITLPILFELEHKQVTDKFVYETNAKRSYPDEGGL